MDLIPIVLFVFNRPLHTQKTLEALSKNYLANESRLYIYADGPKENATESQIEQIEETRRIIRSADWCKEVIIIESDVNNGLANSIVKGVTEVVNKHGKVIVLEDDLITSNGFLQYMNDALNLYEHDKEVMHISGYIYPATALDKTEQTFFLNILSCWGWGTWQRAWKHYNHDIDTHLNTFKSKESIKSFDIYGNANYYVQLTDNKSGKLYSWAVRWYASWLSAGGFSLFPANSLVANDGFDGSGENCGVDEGFNTELAANVQVIKQPIAENLYNRKRIDKFYAKKEATLKRFLINTTMKMGIFDHLKKIKDAIK
ncbi:Glycosyl transferase family 2 [Mucilaginibacter lappiensis]|uniref:Glycosyl transferase family 2 n=1 Tax=Mucilaginibacter lappiensis TaxID=354630 RepID=A0ABR6PLY8_9SPHI|nr:glycosyltransferase [Mucilaginibacter lappiensis]MBB6110777.1 hypothetical protein [Mucilaginibacter lappiensis]SIR63973.1 Glycosyl transferase family 2 [Mucilaginibacter lappiensis]